MPNDTPATEAPAATETVIAAPADIKRVSSSIDTAFASAIFTMATTNASGATNGVIYPSTADDGYKAAVARWRKHLRTRITATQTVKVVPFANGDGYSFAVQVAAKRARKSSK